MGTMSRYFGATLGGQIPRGGGGAGPPAGRGGGGPPRLGLHADAGVQADALGVHVAVAQQLDGHGGELGRVAKPFREEHSDAEALLELLGTFARPVDRCVDESGEDGVDPHADGSEVAGHGQRHTHDAALGGRVGGLADLAVLGGDRRRVDDGAAPAVLVGFVLAHRRRCQADAVERADQVDLDHLAVEIEVVGRAVLAVLADGARRPPDAGTVDQGPQGPKGLGRLDSGDDLLGVGHVGVGEGAAELLGQHLAAIGLKVGDHDLHSPLGEQARRRLTEAGCTTGDDGRSPIEFHGAEP